MKSDFAIRLIQDWTWFVRSLTKKNYNFSSFVFVFFNIEVDRVIGNIEINFVLLGLGIQIIILYKQMDKELERKIKKVNGKAI